MTIYVFFANSSTFLKNWYNKDMFKFTVYVCKCSYTVFIVF